jgi:hypothetical protein
MSGEVEVRIMAKVKKLGKLFRKRYVVGGRNGYNGVDQERYDGEGWSCEKNVNAFRGKKEAEGVAGDLGCAYYDGIMDAHVGLRLKLVRAVEAGHKCPGLPKGTPVRVLSRQGGLFLVEVVSGGLKGERSSYVSLRDLREYELDGEV